jgi:DNA-binding transcriptional LysR family regulator
MELRQLRYLEAVVRHRHFTRAGEELHVAQSALSQQVRGLERELGIQLLQRTTRSVELTEAGALVAVHARAVLAEVAALQAEVDALKGLVRGSITVGALLFGGELDIPALLAEFGEAHPGIEIGLREGSVARVSAGLRDGSVDLMFALEREPSSEFSRIALSREQLVAVFAPSHPLAGSEPLELAALSGQRLIAFGPGSSVRALLDERFARAGARPVIALENNDLALLRALVARGVGAAIMPASFAGLPGQPLSVRPLSPPIAMTVALWWRGDRELSPAARAFREFVVARRPGQRDDPAGRGGT